MAKKKKGNMRNIQPGATVQFLNYLTPDHILRGKYNIGNNELDITDVPANLNSVITLGQGGGGGSIKNPKITMIIANNSSYDVLITATSNVAVYENDILMFKEPVSEISSSSTGTAELYSIPLEEEGDPVSYEFDLTDIVYCPDGNIVFDDIVLTNAQYDGDYGRWIITDPTEDASVSLSVIDDGGGIG